MRAVIVSGGSMTKPEMIRKYIDKGSILIACDSGLNYIYTAGLVPDLILGDFDSADTKVLEYYRTMGRETLVFPVRKDSTDTELGIFAAEDKGADDIVLLAATGNRLDHTIANIQILVPLLKKGIRARLIDEHNIAELISDRLTINNKKGSYISLLPLTERVKGITTEGLDYPLENADIDMGTSLTVSNVIISDRAQVSVKSGILLSIIAED